MSSILPYRTIKMIGKPIKSFIIKVMMFCMGKGFQSLCKRDPDLIEEISAWPDYFSILFEILPKGPNMSLCMVNGRLRFVGLKHTDADLKIVFKNIDSALLVFTGQMGSNQALCEFRMAIKGSLPDGLRLLRCVNIVEFYLFPTLITKKILKRLPRMPFLRLWYGRLTAYLLGVTLGI